MGQKKRVYIYQIDRMIGMGRLSLEGEEKLRTGKLPLVFEDNLMLRMTPQGETIFSGGLLGGGVVHQRYVRQYVWVEPATKQATAQYEQACKEIEDARRAQESGIVPGTPDNLQQAKRILGK